MSDEKVFMKPLPDLAKMRAEGDYHSVYSNGDLSVFFFTDPIDPRFVHYTVVNNKNDFAFSFHFNLIWNRTELEMFDFSTDEFTEEDRIQIECGTDIDDVVEVLESLGFNLKEGQQL